MSCQTVLQGEPPALSFIASFGEKCERVHARVETYKLNENSDDDFERRTDLNQPVGGLPVLIANCAAKARL